MFRKPNKPGRKSSWEIQPGDLPPDWIAKKYGGFEDMENNAVFRYVKTYGALPLTRLEDLRLTPISPLEIIEGHIAGRMPLGKPWYRRFGLRGAIDEVHGLIPLEFRVVRNADPMTLLFVLFVVFLPLAGMGLMFYAIDRLSASEPILLCGLGIFIYICISYYLPLVGHLPITQCRYHRSLEHLTIDFKTFSEPRD